MIPSASANVTRYDTKDEETMDGDYPSRMDGDHGDDDQSRMDGDNEEAVRSVVLEDESVAVSKNDSAYTFGEEEDDETEPENGEKESLVSGLANDRSAYQNAMILEQEKQMIGGAAADTSFEASTSASAMDTLDSCFETAANVCGISYPPSEVQVQDKNGTFFQGTSTVIVNVNGTGDVHFSIKLAAAT
jgi:hypothetical protein